MKRCLGETISSSNTAATVTNLNIDPGSNTLLVLSNVRCLCSVFCHSFGLYVGYDAIAKISPFLGSLQLPVHFLR